MNRNTWEVAFTKQFVEFGCSKGTLDEDDDLIEFEGIKQIVELPILLTLAELDIELLKTVESELGFVVDVHLKWISHELLADGPNFLREGSAEHHHLLLSRSSTEDFLDVPSHVWWVF